MKILKYFLIGLLSLIGLLGLALVLSVTLFKDELIEWVAEQELKENEKYKPYYIAEIPVESENFAEDFRSIHEQVLEECSLYEQKSYAIDSLYTSFANRIGDEVQTKTDYAMLLSEYFASLNIGHASASFKVYSAQYYPTIIKDRVFIDKPSEHLINCGFCDKDEIVAINGIPIDKYIGKRQKYTSASTENYRLRRTQVAVFTSPTDSLITCDIRRGEENVTIELPLNCAPENNTPQAYHNTINDSVGYIYIESMMDDVVEEFKRAYEQVCHLPYLIVDVRNNGGGNSNNGRLIAEYLIRQPQAHCVGGNITPQPNSYKGKLFLLTSNYTFSAAESFTIDLKESGNVILVGEESAGDTGCNPNNFISKYGICFRIPTREPHFSPKGFPMEGVGIEPHYRVEQTVEDFFDNKDTAIEFIISELCE